MYIAMCQTSFMFVSHHSHAVIICLDALQIHHDQVFSCSIHLVLLFDLQVGGTRKLVVVLQIHVYT